MIRRTLSTLKPVVTRRTMLKAGLTTGAAVSLLPWIARTKADSPSLRKYVSRLPIPDVVQPIHVVDMGEPHVRTVVHLHGANVWPDSDGYPEAWFTNNWGQTGPFFTTKD